MPTRVLRNTSAAAFFVAAAFAVEVVYAECPNPKLPWTVTVTGPESACVDAVEEDIASELSGCPHYCGTAGGAGGCGRRWDEDNDTTPGEDYTLEYAGCRVDPENPAKSESGEITCKCGGLIIE